jgi:sulfide:quinone oxidoreductase
MHQVTIIGAGFAALTAVRTLRKLKANVDITLIAPKPEFIFLPSLIWIPSGLRNGDDLRLPLDHFFRHHHVKYLQANATGLGNNGRTVITDQGEIKNDTLLIGSGGRYLKKLPGIEHAITLCEGIKAAENLRDKVQAMSQGTIAVGFGGNPSEPSAMRGGPMFELLFGLDTQLRREGRRDQIELVFFSPAAEPGKRMGAAAVKGLLKEMEKRGIHTHLGHKLKSFHADKVVTEGGEFASDVIAFMPGMTGPGWLEHSDLPRSPGGLIQADAHCRVPGFERVYVAGDAGSFPGPDWMPKQAHMADLQAVAAARNIVAELHGRPADACFKVELVCIVDSLDRGILVFRNLKRTLVLPGRLFHQAKRFFEWHYLRAFR